MEVMCFIYRSGRGEITAREVEVYSKVGGYYQGVCLKAEAARTFREDRILEIVDNPEELDRRLQFYLENSPPPAGRSQIRHPRDPNQIDFCFTGFKKALKQELIKLAEDRGIVVRSSVTVDLACLVYGATAGPRKMEMAQQQGTLTIDEPQFRHLMETGDLPDV